MRRSIIIASLVVVSMATVLRSQNADLERRVDSTVRERGVVESSKVSQVRSPANARIRHLIEEGKSVRKGDLLIELSNPQLEAEIQQLKITVAKHAAVVAAIDNKLEETKTESSEQIALLESGVELAQLNLNRFTGEGGELSLQKDEAKAKLKVAEQRLAESGQLSEIIKRRAENGIDTSAELLKSNSAIVQAEAEIAIAKRKLELIEKHIAPHEVAIRKFELQAAKVALGKATRNNEQQLRQIEAEKAAAELQLAITKKKLSQQQELLSRGRVEAPQDGVVIYESENAARRSTQDTTIRVGAEVRENQNLLKVADLEKLQLDVRVHESKIAKVKLGQPVVIHVDAFPQQRLQGKVLEIGNKAETANWPNTDLKEYSVTVSIDNAPASLKLGLTALAEIDVSKQ